MSRAAMQLFVGACERCEGQWLVKAIDEPGSDEATCPYCQPDRDVECPLQFRRAVSNLDKALPWLPVLQRG